MFPLWYKQKRCSHQRIGEKVSPHRQFAFKRQNFVGLLCLGGLADHEVSHCLESRDHGAQLDLLIGSWGEPVSEEVTRDKSKSNISQHLYAFMILMCYVLHEWSHLLNVSQLDEQTNPNSRRKVHLKGGVKEKLIFRHLSSIKLLKDFEVAKDHQQILILKTLGGKKATFIISQGHYLKPLLSEHVHDQHYYASKGNCIKQSKSKWTRVQLRSGGSPARHFKVMRHSTHKPPTHLTVVIKLGALV